MKAAGFPLDTFPADGRPAAAGGAADRTASGFRRSPAEADGFADIISRLAKAGPGAPTGESATAPMPAGAHGAAAPETAAAGAAAPAGADAAAAAALRRPGEPRLAAALGMTTPAPAPRPTEVAAGPPRQAANALSAAPFGPVLGPDATGPSTDAPPPPSAPAAAVAPLAAAVARAAVARVADGGTPEAAARPRADLARDPVAPAGRWTAETRQTVERSAEAEERPTGQGPASRDGGAVAAAPVPGPEASAAPGPHVADLPTSSAVPPTPAAGVAVSEPAMPSMPPQFSPDANTPDVKTPDATAAEARASSVAMAPAAREAARTAPSPAAASAPPQPAPDAAAAGEATTVAADHGIERVAVHVRDMRTHFAPVAPRRAWPAAEAAATGAPRPAGAEPTSPAAAPDVTRDADGAERPAPVPTAAAAPPLPRPQPAAGPPDARQPIAAPPLPRPQPVAGPPGAQQPIAAPPTAVPQAAGQPGAGGPIDTQPVVPSPVNGGPAKTEAAPATGDRHGRSGGEGSGATVTGLEDAKRTAAAAGRAGPPSSTAPQERGVETADRERGPGAPTATATAAATGGGSVTSEGGGFVPTFRALAHEIGEAARAAAGPSSAASTGPDAPQSGPALRRDVELEFATAEHGLVKVRMRLTGSSLELRLRTDDTATLALLAERRGDLEKALAETGVEAKVVDVARVSAPGLSPAASGAAWPPAGGDGRDSTGQQRFDHGAAPERREDRRSAEDNLPHGSSSDEDQPHRASPRAGTLFV